MNIHDLKIWPIFFESVVAGHKKCEVRKDDRDFNVGDTLNLHEWDPETKKYTGAKVTVKVTHILRGGVFAEMTNPVTGVCAMETDGKFEIATTQA